jgi:hypothetical protein
VFIVVLSSIPEILTPEGQESGSSPKTRRRKGISPIIVFSVKTLSVLKSVPLNPFKKMETGW